MVFIDMNMYLYIVYTSRSAEISKYSWKKIIQFGQLPLIYQKNIEPGIELDFDSAYGVLNGVLVQFWILDTAEIYYRFDEYLAI